MLIQIEQIILKKLSPSQQSILNVEKISLKKNYFFWRYLNMAAAENFAGIDFDEIKEATALEVDEIKVKLFQHI